MTDMVKRAIPVSSDVVAEALARLLNEASDSNRELRAALKNINDARDVETVHAG